MRRTALAFAVVSAVSYGSAAADNFIEAVGGAMLPVEDSQWTDYVDSGPKLAVRIGGSGSGNIGGMFSADWTPITEDDQGFGNAFDISSNRFRLLVNVFMDRKMGPKLTAQIRGGAGIDIASVHVTGDLGPLGMFDNSDSDVGLALEVAGGLWFQAGESVQLGGELALPLGFHGDRDENDITLEEYSSLDIDLLFGVRFMMH
jgi:hypothetical protein